MTSLKDEIVESINELLGDRLSLKSEWALRRLHISELYRIQHELRPERNDMDERVKKAAEKAQIAFWEEMMRQFPEIKTGDLSIEETVDFQRACETAANRRVRWNTREAL